MQRIHFIAIGGSVMHNLAIALKQQGHTVTGSDDEIYGSSRTQLEKHGLMPGQLGWSEEHIDKTLDCVVLGMHAKADNPEVIKAQALGLKIMSMPEFIYEHSKDKQRIVIAGSHGKTTITAIVIYVLDYFKRKFDYVIGAPVAGFDLTVKLTNAPITIIEGDEYFSSALDPTPKFIRYQHHIGLISGVSWDHANVFPSENDYVMQFDRFADATPKGGTLIYNETDSMASIAGKKERADVHSISYKTHSHAIENERYYLTSGKERIPISIFGSHNLQNLSGAKEILKRIGITTEQFFKAISGFRGASGRLEKIKDASPTTFKDFAHAPSKVKASVKAVKDLYPSRELAACLELHTYSSLNKKFLPQYHDSLKGVQIPMVYFNPEKVKAKNLDPITADDIKKAFGQNSIEVFHDAAQLKQYLTGQHWKNKNLLMMSSGDFGGLNIDELAATLNP